MSPQSLGDYTCTCVSCTFSGAGGCPAASLCKNPFYEDLPLPRPRPFGGETRTGAFGAAAFPSLGVVAGETRERLRGGRPPRHKFMRAGEPPALEADALSKRPMPLPVSTANGFTGGGGLLIAPGRSLGKFGVVIIPDGTGAS